VKHRWLVPGMRVIVPRLTRAGQFCAGDRGVVLEDGLNDQYAVLVLFDQHAHGLWVPTSEVRALSIIEKIGEIQT